MLKKLIKYDLRWINKIMVIYFIITLIVCILTRIFSFMNSSIVGNIIYTILKSVAISCFVSCIINLLIRTWIRFRNTTYKDEAYLINTLPVDKRTLYNSKVLSSIISLFITMFVIISGFSLAFLDNDVILFIKNIVNNNTLIALLLILLLILEIFYMLFCGLTGIIMGYSKNNKRIIHSVIIGIGSYFIMQIIILGIVYLLSLFSNDLKDLFVSKSIDNYSFFEQNGMVFKKLTLIISFMYSILIIAMYYVGKKRFIKGINVE